MRPHALLLLLFWHRYAQKKTQKTITISLSTLLGIGVVCDCAALAARELAAHARAYRHLVVRVRVATHCRVVSAV
jgi:hypothetical protein